MLLGGPLTYRTLHFLMIKLCISKVSNTPQEYVPVFASSYRYRTQATV
jgi:hypothetical protein